MSEGLIQRDLELLPQASREAGDAQSYMAQSSNLHSLGQVQVSSFPYSSKGKEYMFTHTAAQVRDMKPFG